jgi:hypothetical protein
MSSNHCLADRIDRSLGGPTYKAEVRIPFEQKLTREQADAIAHDFAHHVLEHTDESHRAVDLTDHFGIKYEIMPKEGHPNYAMMSTLANGVEGARGMVYIKRSLVCRHPLDVLMEYSPNGTLEALMETKKLHDKVNSRLRWAWNASVGLAELACFWPVARRITNAVGKENIPLWVAVPVLLVGWSYALLDGIHRIGMNIPVYRAGELERTRRKKPAKQA